MSSPTDNDLIEKRILGKLTDEEIRSFETRLGDDREFARKYRLIKTFPEMMSKQGRLEYEKKLADAAVPVVKKKFFPIRKIEYLVWGTVLVIACITIILLFILTGKNHRMDIAVREDTIAKTAVTTGKVEPVVKQQQQEKREIREVSDKAGQETIVLLNPPDGMKFSRKDTILFSWTQKTDTFTRFYIYSEIHDQVVFWRGIKPGIREYKVSGRYLYPGKFYWYVGAKETKHTFLVTE